MRPHFAIALLLACCTGVQAAAPAEQTVSASRLIAAARAALPVPAAMADLSITAQVIGTPQDATVPNGAATLHANAPIGRWPRSRVAVPVAILIDGKVVRTETVWFAVTALHTALVYAADAPAATLGPKLKVHRAAIDIATVDSTPVAALTEVANERLQRGVHAGWPMLAHDFEPIPDVDKDAKVIVHVRYGPVRMEALAVALDAGNVGDTVSVLVKGAASPVQARVTAKGVVDIAR